jgi:hypothetical protein
MNQPFKPLYWTAALLLSAAAFAQTPPAPAAAAPAGSAGQCKDGTYSSATTMSGACSGHQGIRNWWGVPAATTATPAAAPALITSAVPARGAAPAATAAPGGGPGLVWVNGGSKVYHCQGDEWYGTTKQGQYMSEADAKTAGNRPAHGKSCS